MLKRSPAGERKNAARRRPARAVVVIPARWAATRLPGKVLADVHGRPLIERIVAVCRRARAADEVLVATDDRRVYQAAEQAGARAVLTSPRLRSGSDRVAAVTRRIKAEIIVNVQGDEFFDRPNLLDRLIMSLRQNRDIDVATLARSTTPGEAADPHLVKVVCDREGNALYFSRRAIPFYRDGKKKPDHLGHIGIYAFRRAALLKFAAAGKTPLEAAENLEQLRLLERGVRIRVLQTSCLTVGVDTPADLRKLRLLIKNNRLHLRGEP